MSIHELVFAAGESSLSVRRFAVEEAVSSLFTVSVWARSPDSSLDLASIVGLDASIRLASGYKFALGGGVRLWSGIVSQVGQVEPEPTGLSTYYLRIVPRLWLLTQRRGHRIFQHLCIPDIIDKLLGEWHIPPVWRIQRSKYPPLEYKIQYGESDFDFFCRLLEEAGISFTFPNDDTQGSRLTLSDEPHAAHPRAAPLLPFVDNPNESSEFEYVSHVRTRQAVCPGALTIRDHDFRKPAFRLLGKAINASEPERRLEQYHYQPGSFLTEDHKPSGTPSADDRGVARHHQSFGDDRATRALLGERAEREHVSFETNAVDLCPGTIFSIDNHPHPALPAHRRLLATRFYLEGTSDGEWTMTGDAVLADKPYRPPLRTSKPEVYGVQSAKVVGPKGQEIHTDEFGRVRVQFSWDREGGGDDSASCWIRVNQGWGGRGYGFLVLPRIGQEVLVTFEHGDPDRPVLAGRMFNAMHPVPYTLPANKTISTWKSESSPGGDGFNEIKFEDKKADELFYVQAEKNLRKLVKHDETITVLRHREKHVGANETDTTGVNRVEVTGLNRSETTGANRTTAIGGNRRALAKGNRTSRIEGHRQRLVNKDADIVIKGSRRERLDNDVHVTVQGDRSERIDGNQSMTVVHERHEKVIESYALEAGKEIHVVSLGALISEGAVDVTLKGPGGFVRIDASGVTIEGTLVKINVDGSPGKGKGSRPQPPNLPNEASGVDERSDLSEPGS